MKPYIRKKLGIPSRKDDRFGWEFQPVRSWYWLEAEECLCKLAPNVEGLYPHYLFVLPPRETLEDNGPLRSLVWGDIYHHRTVDMGSGWTLVVFYHDTPVL